MSPDGPRLPFLRLLLLQPIALLPLLAALVLQPRDLAAGLSGMVLNHGIWLVVALALGIWAGWHVAATPRRPPGSQDEGAQ